MQKRSRHDGTTSPALFAVHFAVLLLLGPAAAIAAAAAGTLLTVIAERGLSLPPRRFLLDEVAALVSLLAAAWVHAVLGGTVGTFSWPRQAIPVGGAAAVYVLATIAIRELLVPFVRTRALDAAWRARLLQSAPILFVAASVATLVADVLVRRAWAMLPVTAFPIYMAWYVHRDQARRLERAQRRTRVLESLGHGICVVDAGGQVTFWNDALGAMTGCPRERAVGRTLEAAVPSLAQGEVARTIPDVAATRVARTLPHVGITTPGGTRVLRVEVHASSGDVMLLWQDVTDATQAEQARRRQEERLALAAEGAQDGLWEWNLRTQELYVTGRWRALLGLPPTAAVVRADEWLGRVHPEDVAGVRTALEAHLAGGAADFQHQHRIRHADGSYRTFLCRGVAAGRAGRRADRLAGSLTDVTDRVLTQQRLRNAVFLDPLTGLGNRAVFVERLGRRLDEYKLRPGGDRFAVLYLDLDRFKIVNDSLGHLVGDELLVAVSRRLESCLRQGDALARLGGDEFAILLNGLHAEQQANVVAFRVQEALSRPFTIGGREVFTSASIGIAFGLTQYATPDEIMHDADTAMYHAKARGKARHEVFDADMDARVRDRLGLENDLRHAIMSKGLEVHYQPIVALASRRCVGFESLVRWQRNGAAVSPATFVPIAEELGLIEPLGTWVLQEACRTFAEWKRRFPAAALDYITVNVSSRQLTQQNFLSVVEQAVRRAELKPCDLRIEITETALMDNPGAAAEVLGHLRAFGARIYLDDFGTGYSSLSHLHKLPVDALKIDRSFVRSLLLPDRPAIVESILALARTLNTGVVAEGIESDVEARALERLGCTHAQGYLFSRPLSTGAVEAMLTANVPLGAAPVAAKRATS